MEMLFFVRRYYTLCELNFGAGRIRPCRLYGSIHAVKAFDKAKGERDFRV